MAKKGKPLKRNWISSDSSTNQRHKDYAKTRIEQTQQNGRCRLCGHKDETIDHIISECSKLTQTEYKTRHDWVERWSTGNYAKNWNVTIRTNSICTTQNPPKKMKCTIFFEMQTDHLISARRPDLVIVNKKRTCRIVDFGWPQGKSERKRKEK